MEKNLRETLDTLIFEVSDLERKKSEIKDDLAEAAAINPFDQPIENKKEEELELAEL